MENGSMTTYWETPFGYGIRVESTALLSNQEQEMAISLAEDLFVLGGLSDASPVIVYDESKARLVLNNSSVLSLEIWVDQNVQSHIADLAEQRELMREKQGNY